MGQSFALHYDLRVLFLVPALRQLLVLTQPGPPCPLHLLATAQPQVDAYPGHTGTREGVGEREREREREREERVTGVGTISQD